MTLAAQIPGHLPSADEIRRAVEIFLAHAYKQPTSQALRFRPAVGFRPAEWLMSDIAERDPADAPPVGIRSFALRIGNAQYRHMKLRLSRPPKDAVFLFGVDAHDAFLNAPAGSPDHKALEELKRHNADIAAAIAAAWDAEGLPTERTYLRGKIEEAKRHTDAP